MPPAILLTIGNPLLDISVRNGEKLLEKYHLKANDAILADAKRLPIYDEITSLDPAYVSGGSAQNTARCAQYVLPAGSVVYLGSVGQDSFADKIKAANEREGLEDVFYVDEKTPTGACAVVLTGHNRSLCTRLGAAEKFPRVHLNEPRVIRAFLNAKYFYLEGYFLTHGLESAKFLAEHACEYNKLFTLNLSAPFIPQVFKNNVDAMMAFVDVVIGNDSEASSYAKVHRWATTDPAVIAARMTLQPKLNKKRPRLVIITQGSSFTVVACSTAEGLPTASKRMEGAYVYTVPVTPLPDEAIVDTNGAGDAFAGGFMASMIRHKTIEESVEFGHKLGQMCVGQNGPTLKWPKEDETLMA